MTCTVTRESIRDSLQKTITNNSWLKDYGINLSYLKTNATNKLTSFSNRFELSIPNNKTAWFIDLNKIKDGLNSYYNSKANGQFVNFYTSNNSTIITFSPSKKLIDELNYLVEKDYQDVLAADRLNNATIDEQRIYNEIESITGHSGEYLDTMLYELGLTPYEYYINLTQC
jgi:hypothetical protein